MKWERLFRYFTRKYLSKWYHDRKRKEFYELGLGQLTMDEYVSKFLELLRYDDYIKEEKVKIQIFVSGMP